MLNFSTLGWCGIMPVMLQNEIFKLAFCPPCYTVHEYRDNAGKKGHSSFTIKVQLLL